ncbi:inositol monophosphatase family protein [Listeria costaricensis]|uniref:inositol monophosphatase family protein n=1 Tax=Listeria costaricensis TaxID=2026604 RepID=UPI000C069B7E|nr:inositol monophosphatase family protein [Listeria costaricensis]
MELEIIDQKAREWLNVAAERIRASFQTDLSIDTKSGRNDLVTNMDKETERYFVEVIRAAFPTHRVFGEEGMADKLSDLHGTVWIIDPIDGTLNFVTQKRGFAISVAVYQEGIGQLGYIYDVEKDELYFGKKGHGAFVNGQKIAPVSQESGLADHLLIANLSASRKYPVLWEAIKASRGLRLYGAASLEYMAVATGRAGAYLSANLAPWDLAAGKIIAEEVGCIVKRLDQTEIDMLEKGSSIVALPQVYDELMKNYLK